MKYYNQGMKQTSKYQFGLTFAIHIKMWETQKENTAFLKAT